MSSDLRTLSEHKELLEITSRNSFSRKKREPGRMKEGNNQNRK
jgi:hypothetical protein